MTLFWDGNYNVTVTDSKGCSASTSGFIYERYEPFIFALNTSVCEGESVTLSVNGQNVSGYEWSASAGGATTQTVTVFPTGPSTSYSVTVTNNIGCTTEAEAIISVDATPTTSISGDTDICIGEHTQMLPSSGGIWTSSNSTVATITNTGLVTANSAGNATFTYRNNLTGCYSDPSNAITVQDNIPVTILGENIICFTDNPTFTASAGGGSWSSSNTNVAVINSAGLISPISQGTAIIYYDIPGASCYDRGSINISIYNDPTLSLNGPSTICEDDNTFVNASVTGSWTSSNDEIATISSSGVITGVSAGTATISFMSAVGCTATLSTPIEVVGKQDVSLVGPSEICVNETTTLSPSTGGIWISSNNNVASVSSSGVVTAKNPGTASFNFIESSNGCLSDDMITVTIYGPPTITGLSDDELCIGDFSSITPTSGGTWMSTDESVAIIADNGIITAIGPGSARFLFTNNATGCTSAPSAPITVNDKPTISITGLTSICIDETTSITPTSGGQWSSTDVSVATITQNGIITGVSPGTVKFIFTNTFTGCSSDESEPITVNEPTTIALTGPDRICIGDITNLTPNTGGSWISNNPGVATISSNGEVIGQNPGTATFVFNSNTGCSSDPSIEITIDPNPVTSFIGPSEICIGSTTQLSPNTGGEWTSTNTDVATVDNSGLVTAVGFGTVQFVFEDENTTCEATTDGTLTVYEKPIVNIIGDKDICIGFSTFLTPNTGGVWTSSNNSVATISPSGQVTAVSVGSATFTFYETGSTCVSEPSAPIIVLPKSPVDVTGPNAICVGNTSTLSPTTGGSWTSNNTSVASVDDFGNVVGVGQGIVRFTFISDAGCASDETSPIVVYGPPFISISGSSEICIDDNLQMLPSTGGTWESSDEEIATIDDTGLVEALDEGTVRFTFTDAATGCVSEDSDIVTINGAPDTDFNGPSLICIGGTTFLTPSTGGVWLSLNPAIASIQNNGLVTGISPGDAYFQFTELGSGCPSEPTGPVTVDSGPTISYTGPKELCIGSVTNVIPNTGGTWESTDPTVATISNDGLVTAISGGTAKFLFTETGTGCKSELSDGLIVNDDPTVVRLGESIICIGAETNVSPTTGGEWESLNTDIATITNAGIVTGIAEGTAFFRFTNTSTTCESDGTLSIDVRASLEAEVTGDLEICTGYTTTLSPSSGGLWTSSNPEIATVSNFGLVTGRAPGVVTFTFVDSDTGCSAGGTTDPVSVNQCINNDFNVGLVDTEVKGNIETNDLVPTGTTYSNNKITLSKPLASLPQLTINSDGTYTFNTNKAGKYIYKVPVCIPPMTSGCPTTILEITIVENVYAQSNPVGNLEFTTTFTNSDPAVAGSTVLVRPMENDKCVYTGGCDLDETSLEITDNPENGVVVNNGDGTISYTPNAGFIGHDTIGYKVCVTGTMLCDESSQVITVNHTSAVNSIVAADDFTFTFKETEVSGNVRNNDHDPEGNGMAVVQQGSLISPIVTSDGSYYINSDGSYMFTPNATFSGSTEIIYTICDDNLTTACSNATLRILVFDDLKLELQAYLEGALIENNNARSSENRPLMRDDLRVNPYNSVNYIPAKDPYSFVNGPFDITRDSFEKIGPGLLAMNQEILDSASVFSVTGQDAIVDWVFIEIRDKDDNTNVLATRSGLIQRDGDIVDLDGVSPLRFQAINIDSFYVCLRHRTHLSVMSSKVSNGAKIDFSSPDTELFNFGTSLNNGVDYTGLSQKSGIEDGYLALWAGDFNNDGIIKFTEPASDQNIIFGDVLFNSPEFLINYDFAYGYYKGDYNMNGKAKFTNPDDDKNYLLGQILFYPPNTGYIALYGNMIQQVPK